MRNKSISYLVAVTALLSAISEPSVARWPEPTDDSYAKVSIVNTLSLDCWGRGNRFAGEKIDAAVKVEFENGQGRIRLPNVLIPPINSGGRKGWWNLYNIRFGRDLITAQYRMNDSNQPKVEINRTSGQIKIDGFEKYRGECDVGDSDAGFNRF